MKNFIAASGIAEFFTDHFLSCVKSHFNRYDQFEFTDIEQIAPDQKYIIFINYGEIFRKKFDRYENVCYSFFKPDIHRYNNDNTGLHLSPVVLMPRRVWDDSGKGLVHWIICIHTEHYLLDRVFDVAQLHSAFNTTTDNITVATALETDPKYTDIRSRTFRDTGIKLITFNTLKYNVKFHDKNTYTDIVNQKLSNIQNKNILDYKSLCYNRLPRSHRAIIVSHMLYNNKLYSDCNYSFGIYVNNEKPDLYFNYYNSSGQFDYLAQKHQYLTNLDNNISLPYEDDNLVYSNDNRIYSFINTQHIFNTSFQIVTETFLNSAAPFITEKSYKPFIMMQPFIQYGNYKAIQVLRDKGYKTFDKWIDQSYDNEVDDVKRMIMFLKEMDRLQSFSKEEWADILYDMQDDLMHNLAVVSAPDPATPLTDITKILINFYKSH